MNVSEAIEQLRSERERLTRELADIEKAVRALTGLASTKGSGRSNRVISTSARRRIAAAQKARWAKWRKQHKGSDR